MMATDGTVPCTYCERPVNPQARETWHRVIGWERPGRKGGSDIACRQPQARYACDMCVRRMQRGVSPAQGSLL
jgi:hypothetical protein